MRMKASEVGALAPAGCGQGRSREHIPDDHVVLRPDRSSTCSIQHPLTPDGCYLNGIRWAMIAAELPTMPSEGEPPDPQLHQTAH